MFGYEYIIQEKMKEKIRYIIAGLFFVFIMGAGLLFATERLIRHEHDQNARITALQAQLGLHLAEENTGDFDQTVYTDSGYNYLAIGNSITRHSINEYWWNEIGMAATAQEKDYVHLVADGIEKSWVEDNNEKKMDDVVPYDQVNLVIASGYIWEIQAADRAETYAVLDPYLSPKLDLVTIQLGENVTDTSTLEKDFEELVRHIREKCSNAEILMVGDFWKDSAKDNAKKNAAAACGVTYIDLEDIQDKKEYQAGMGSIVYDADGAEHVIDHEGVAAHPGDKGMKEIAARILQSLQ